MDALQFFLEQYTTVDELVFAGLSNSGKLPVKTRTLLPGSSGTPAGGKTSC